jgi:hypothetical protein
MDTKKTPHYVVLVDENTWYKLDENKLVIGKASDQLIEFAKQKGLQIPNDVSAWDRFAMDFGLSVHSRKQLRCYLLSRQDQTDEERRRLAEM